MGVVSVGVRIPPPTSSAQPPPLLLAIREINVVIRITCQRDDDRCRVRSPVHKNLHALRLGVDAYCLRLAGHDRAGFPGVWLLRASGEPSCPWDCQAVPDGAVNVPDLLALLAVWNIPGNSPCDFDNTNLVNVPDLLKLLANWGPCP